MQTRSQKSLVFLGVMLALGAAYVLAYRESEPFFNNDETRHVMTGVYFRDLLADLPVGRLRDYTVNYYLQHPALGLMVWPPFFYFVEGLAMSVFGTSLVVSKTLVALFAVVACAYLFRLVCRTHDTARAVVAVLVFGLSPLVFSLSHYVMLEVPTLALGLAATYHFVCYAEDNRRRDLVLAGLFSALAALTRFDAVYLLPLFLILLFARRGCWKILWRADVLVVAALALLLVAPFYAISASGIGWMHFKFVTETLSPSDPGFLSLDRLVFYPSRLPAQLGWPVLITSLVGVVWGLGRARRERSYVYLAMIAAVYLTFTPMGELESRHAIYWTAAFAFFAADTVALLAGRLRLPQLQLPLAACVLAAALWGALSEPLPRVRGYEEAARAVAAEPGGSPFCLFVGRLNGNFIYQLRRHDPARRLWVLRADKLLFSVLVVPGIQHRQLAAGDEDVLDAVYKYDPEFIVTEEPHASSQTNESEEERLRGEFERRVREVVNNHPERFELERSIAVESDDARFRGMTLKVFRNKFRNENPERRLALDVLMLRRTLETVVP